MLYNIINAHDAYTMEANDFKIAAVANLLQSDGYDGLEPVDGEGSTMPILFLGGMEKWIDENICPHLDLVKFINEHRLEIADALDSIVCGSSQDRKLYLMGLGMASTPEKKKAWRDKWQDEKRGSLSDIGTHAWRMAERLRKKA